MRRKYFFLPAKSGKPGEEEASSPCRLVLGLVLVLSSLASAAFLSPGIRAAVAASIRAQSALTPQSQMLGVWTAPPVVPRMKVYVFNVTNAGEFLKGEDERARVEEVGPYTYEARIIKEVRRLMN